MSSLSTTALVEGGKAVALSVILGAVLSFVPLLSIAAVPAMPVPAAFITTRHGPLLGITAGLSASLLCAFFAGPFAGLLVFLLAAVVGTGAGLAVRKNFPLFRLFVLVAALFMVSLVIWTGATLASAGLSPIGAVDSMIEQTIGPASDLYSSLGMSQQSIDEAIGNFRDFAAVLPYLLPAMLLVVSISLSGATVALAKQVFDRLKQPFPANISFRDFRLHFAFAYLMIIGLLSELVAPYIPEAYSEPVRLAGMNLLIVSELLFFVQGIAIAYFFLCLYKVSRPQRILVYCGLVLIQLLFSLVSWLGLFDTWIDYRRRFGKKKAAGQQNRQ